jgi:3-dehydroquinate synthase II
VTHDRVLIAPTGSAPDDEAAIVERARRRGFTRFVLSSKDGFAPRPGEELLFRHQDSLDRESGPSGTIPVVRVGDPVALEAALRGPASTRILAIEWTGDRVIPLENAIAAAGADREIWVFAREPREVSGALGALEHGARRVIVTVRTPQEVDEVEGLLEAEAPTSLDWATVPVTSVRPAGIGDRVLVDTTSLLDGSEGLLVGSAAGFLFHVASEAVGSEFSRPRPFRVNAGAAHSYVLLADGTTRYLSELEPGEAVLACRPRGPARSVRVGRVKIERRPLVVVTASVGGVERTVFLQEAETVRLSSEGGRIPTTMLDKGSLVYGVRMTPARHLGRAIEETIVER